MMYSADVVTQKDLQTELTKSDPIGMGSYNSDFHNIQRVAGPDGMVINEGDAKLLADGAVCELGSEFQNRALTAIRQIIHPSTGRSRAPLGAPGREIATVLVAPRSEFTIEG